MLLIPFIPSLTGAVVIAASMLSPEFSSGSGIKSSRDAPSSSSCEVMLPAGARGLGGSSLGENSTGENSLGESSWPRLIGEICEKLPGTAIVGDIGGEGNCVDGSGFSRAGAGAGLSGITALFCVCSGELLERRPWSGRDGRPRPLRLMRKESFKAMSTVRGLSVVVVVVVFVVVRFKSGFQLFSDSLV